MNRWELQASIQGDYQRIGELLLKREVISLDDLLQAIRLQRVDRLQACPLFSSLSAEELDDLSAVFQEVTVSPGAQFITQDAKDPSLYVLADGRLEVFRVGDDEEEIRLASVFPGEPVGEMGYFADGVRSASVHATNTSRLLRTSYDDLTDCFESIPAVAGAFMDVVTHRLRKTNLLYQEREKRQHTGNLSLGHLSDYLDFDVAKELTEGIDDHIKRVVFTASKLTDADRATLFLIARKPVNSGQRSPRVRR